jgi:PAS domain S-box-containing protein
MKGSKNKNGARVPGVPPPAENDDPNGRWSIEERDQLLLCEREARLEAEVMRDANLALTQDLSLERILETLLDYLRKLVPFDSANVMLVEGDSSFVTNAIKGYEDFLEDISLAKANIFSPKTSALFRQICETKQSLLVSDTKDEPRWQSVPGSEQIRNWIGVPLIAHGEIMGLYSLDKAQPGYFTAEHVRKAEVLAAQAATAIRNARLFRQVENSAAELELSIKERDREKSALRKAEKKYRDILNSVHEGVFQTTPEGRFMTANQALARMLGFDSPDELIRTRTDIAREHYVDPDRRKEFKRLLDSEGVVRNFEHEAYTKDGSTIWIAENVRAVRDERGVVLRYEGICQDVTERRRAEEELRESEESYRDLVENSRESICTHDLDGLILSANRAAIEVLGYDPKGYCGKKSFREILIPEVRDRFDDYLVRIRRDGFASGLALVQTAAGERRVWEYHNTLRTEGVAAPIVRGMARDITERKRAEDALRESESFRRTIVESEPECVKLVAPDYTLLDMNPAGLSMIGAVSKEQVVGCSVLSLVAPEWHNTYKQIHERVCQGESVVAEFEVIGLTGVRRWMETHAAPLRNRESQVIAQLAITRDITERKRAAESLQVFRNLIDQSSDAIEVIDPITLRFLDCNQSAYRSLGYSREEFLSLTVFDIDPLADHSMMARLDAEMKESGFATLESLHLRKDGTTFPVEVNVKLVRLETDYRLAVVRDITERKRVENALQESEERFRQLSEATFEAIILHDQGTILEVNQSFCRMYGYERADVIGKSVLDLTLPEFREPLLQRIRSGRTGSFEGLALRKDGTIFRTEVAAEPFHYRGSVVRVAAIRDITEQKRNERRQAAQYVVAKVLAESATLAEAIPQLLKVIGESLRWKMGEFWRVCDSTNLLRCVETWHVPALDATSIIQASRQTEFAQGVGLPGRVWQSGQPAWISDVMTDPCFARREIAAQVGLHSALAFPILLGNRTLGVMLFFSRRTPEVDEDLLKMMSVIGSQIGQFTERKRAEEALRQSEVYFRSLIEHTADTISTYDANGVRLYTSPSIERILGYKPEEMIGQSGFELLHPDDCPLLVSLFAQAAQIPGTIVTKELRYRHKDGTWRTLESTGSNLLDNPAVGAVVVNSRDITERQRAEAALRESEERYRDLVENSEELICTHDLEGLILSVNRAAAANLGYRQRDYAGKKNLRDILPLRVRGQFDDYLAKLRNEGFARGLTLVQTSDGETRIWEYYNTLRTEGVATPIVRGMAHDITERKRAEEAMSALRRELELTMNSMEEGVHRVNLQGDIVFENPAAARMLGWEVAELLGKPGHLTMHHAREDGTLYPKEECPIYATLRDGIIRQVADEVFWRRDGTSFPVEYMTAPMRNDRNEIVAAVVTFRDITDRKRAQDALRIYSQRLIQAQDAERRHIARELHDEIGQVLTAVKINLQSVQRSCRTADCLPRLDESIGIVDEALGCVRELSIELHPSLLDDLGLTAALRWYVDRYAERTGIMAELLNGFKEDGRLPRELETACFRIAQEALTNVARHAQAGSVSVHLERSTERVLLTVMDDGVGFDIDNLRKKAQAASTLGLRGMEERALAVGGHIEIDSGSGRGTRVHATFPLKRK